MGVRSWRTWACLGAVLVAAILGRALPPPLGAARSCAAASFPRGTAFLASEIGNELPVESAVGFIEATGFRTVVVDWAWITAHWERTDWAAANRLVGELQANGVQVAAMYRPRFLSDPTVPTQVKRNGEPALDHGHEICFSSPEARRWGLSWGEKILRQCPTLDTIIVYNPRNLCECPACLAAKENDPAAPTEAVWSFLREAKEAWQAIRPQVRLGVVYTPEADFWTRGRGIVDVAYPFAAILEGADPEKEIASALAVRDVLPEQFGGCLAKVTWGADDKVPPATLGAFDRLARERDLPYILWTFDTLFRSELYDPQEVCAALGLDWPPVQQALGAPSVQAGAGEGKQYALDEIAATEAEVFFERLAKPEPGRHPCAAMWALIAKAKNGGAEAKTQVIDRAIAIIHDSTLPSMQRWQSIYVLSGIGDERAVPVIAGALRDDPNEVHRGVAASALRSFNTPGSRTALQEALETEKSERVLKWVRQSLEALGGPTTTVPLSQATDFSNVVGLALVKDFMLIENTGDGLADVEFPRYFPAVDDQQVVLARWVEAHSDAGETIPVRIVSVEPDEEHNLIHTYRLARFPASERVLVTVTSLVARHEPVPPKAGFPIPRPEEYPAYVQPFLANTSAIVRDHAVIQAEAQELLAKSHDALEVAQELARRMAAKGYTREGEAERGLPAAVATLKYGGSCCVSAMAAVSVLRACGIPAQITYCPAGYIHGITQFWLNGYGWVRMDSTCGVGRLPLVQDESQLGLVRLFDEPIAGEYARWDTIGWPYHNGTPAGPYEFRSNGQACPTLRFAMREPDPPSRIPGSILKPFPHLESGNWNQVLGTVPFDGPWKDWAALKEASEAAVLSEAVGEFTEVTARVPGVADYADKAVTAGLVR